MKIKQLNFTVPLVSRMLPSDICKIHKAGACIRMDTTLVDFNDMRWERGDISFIFNGTHKPNRSLTVLDNKQKLFQRLMYEVRWNIMNKFVLFCVIFTKKYANLKSFILFLNHLHVIFQKEI